jgi:hypothetical protein
MNRSVGLEDRSPPSPALPLAASIATPQLDHEQQHAASEVAGVARCPLCHAPLVARLNCRGPYFQCLCHESGLGE